MDDAACRSFAENLASPIAELSLGPADLTDIGVHALCTAIHMSGLRTLELKYLANLSDEGLITISTSLLSLQVSAFLGLYFLVVFCRGVMCYNMRREKPTFRTSEA